MYGHMNIACLSADKNTQERSEREKVRKRESRPRHGTPNYVRVVTSGEERSVTKLLAKVRTQGESTSGGTRSCEALQYAAHGRTQ